MTNKMLATFSENVLSNDIIVKPVDGREFLYSHNDYIPVSSLEPVVWYAGDHSLNKTPDIIDKGDRMVSKLIMNAIMAWDPYGVIFVPAVLKSESCLSEERYIMSTNNLIDVMNDDDSHTYMKDKSRYGKPPKLMVTKLYICEEKYNSIPEHKKHIFRVKGSDNTIFFSRELVCHVWNVAEKNGARGLVMQPFNFEDKAPVF